MTTSRMALLLSFSVGVVAIGTYSLLHLHTPTLPTAQSGAARCVAPNNRAIRFPDSAALKAGRYTLTLVADSGAPPQATTSGTLWLWRTSTHDRSPRNGQRATTPDTVHAPFFGATTIDYAPVNAPVAIIGDDAEPAPDSRDPVYPGVLVLKGGVPGDSEAARYTILVSTVTNRRDGLMVEDGTGIALSVRARRDSTFVGDWSEWGILRGGYGHFCVTPID